MAWGSEAEPWTQLSTHGVQILGGTPPPGLVSLCAVLSLSVASSSL